MSETFEFTASDGARLHCYRWLPEATPRGIIHIAHGMGEHAGRYDPVGSHLAEADYVVIADDHRGHGKTATTLGHFGEDGWNRAITDLSELIADHRGNWPGIPVVLLGHSMGAMMTQHYLTRHGTTVDMAILSGSPGFAGGFQSWLVRTITRFERWRVGPEGKSGLLEFLIFGSANKAFEDETPEPTGFEWLSRDAAEVRRYVDDPMCGFVPDTGSLFDLFAGNHEAASADGVLRIPAWLPVLVFSGTADPVHGEMKNIDRLLSLYRSHGMKVDTIFYDGGRHEMFNETNRSAVLADVTSWIDGRCRS